MQLVTTLNKIRKAGPCKTGWNKLLKHLGKTKANDDPRLFTTILASNGLEDAWAAAWDAQKEMFLRFCNGKDVFNITTK